MNAHRSLETSIRVFEHVWDLLYRKAMLKEEWAAYPPNYNEEAHHEHVEVWLWGCTGQGGTCWWLILNCMNKLLIVECFIYNSWCYFNFREQWLKNPICSNSMEHRYDHENHCYPYVWLMKTQNNGINKILLIINICSRSLIKKVKGHIAISINILQYPLISLK